MPAGAVGAGISRAGKAYRVDIHGDGQPCKRGDDWPRIAAWMLMQGPAPRARVGRGPAGSHGDAGGTSPACADDAQCVGRLPGLLGTSPACAGTTIADKRFRVRVGDQPRLRGDDNATNLTAMPALGTSPACAGTPPRFPSRS